VLRLPVTFEGMSMSLSRSLITPVSGVLSPELRASMPFSGYADTAPAKPFVQTESRAGTPDAHSSAPIYEPARPLVPTTYSVPGRFPAATTATAPTHDTQPHRAQAAYAMVTLFKT
jgi:hypothetical protein